MNQFLTRFGKYLESREREVWHQVNLEDRTVKALLPLKTGDYLFKLWFTDFMTVFHSAAPLSRI
jgi:hypothetical protein